MRGAIAGRQVAIERRMTMGAAVGPSTGAEDAGRVSVSQDEQNRFLRSGLAFGSLQAALPVALFDAENSRCDVLKRSSICGRQPLSGRVTLLHSAQKGLRYETRSSCTSSVNASHLTASSVAAAAGHASTTDAHRRRPTTRPAGGWRSGSHPRPPTQSRSAFDASSRLATRAVVRASTPLQVENVVAGDDGGCIDADSAFAFVAPHTEVTLHTRKRPDLGSRLSHKAQYTFAYVTFRSTSVMGVMRLGSFVAPLTPSAHLDAIARSANCAAQLAFRYH